MTDTIKRAPVKWVHIKQGPTTAVYFFKAGDNVLETIITHQQPLPMLFTKGVEIRRLRHEV